MHQRYPTLVDAGVIGAHLGDAATKGRVDRFYLKELSRANPLPQLNGLINE
jgi:hypothetical protein